MATNLAYAALSVYAAPRGGGGGVRILCNRMLNRKKRGGIVFRFAGNIPNVACMASNFRYQFQCFVRRATLKSSRKIDATAWSGGVLFRAITRYLTEGI